MQLKIDLSKLMKLEDMLGNLPICEDWCCGLCPMQEAETKRRREDKFGSKLQRKPLLCPTKISAYGHVKNKYEMSRKKEEAKCLSFVSLCHREIEDILVADKYLCKHAIEEEVALIIY